MHYTGMAAMRMTPGIDYDPTLFGASLMIAVVASGAALWIAFNLRRNINLMYGWHGWRRRGDGRGYRGDALHRMAAARFADGSFCGAALTGLSGKGLDNLVLVTSLAVLVIALLTWCWMRAWKRAPPCSPIP